MGVEAVSFPLEDKCQDLLDAQVVQKAQLDQLPFEVDPPRRPSNNLTAYDTQLRTSC